jgi:hypothetical protein
MAATTMSPAIRAYSRTSPPHSSNKKAFSMLDPFVRRITRSLDQGT